MSCRWTLCNELKSIPTKISTGIAGDSGFLASKGYMTWGYVINTDAGMKEARKIRNGYEKGMGRDSCPLYKSKPLRKEANERKKHDGCEMQDAD